MCRSSGTIGTCVELDANHLFVYGVFCRSRSVEFRLGLVCFWRWAAGWYWALRFVVPFASHGRHFHVAHHCFAADAPACSVGHLIRWQDFTSTLFPEPEGEAGYERDCEDGTDCDACDCAFAEARMGSGGFDVLE